MNFHGLMELLILILNLFLLFKLLLYYDLLWAKTFILEESFIISDYLNPLFSLFISLCKFLDSFKNNLLSYFLYIVSNDSHKSKILSYLSESLSEKKICEKIFIISLTNSFKEEYQFFLSLFNIAKLWTVYI